MSNCLSSGESSNLPLTDFRAWSHQQEGGHQGSAAGRARTRSERSTSSGGPQRPLRARSLIEATMDEEARQGFLGAPLAAWTRACATGDDADRDSMGGHSPPPGPENRRGSDTRKAAPRVTADVDHLQAGALGTVACPDRKSEPVVACCGPDSAAWLMRTSGQPAAIGLAVLLVARDVAIDDPHQRPPHLPVDVSRRGVAAPFGGRPPAPRRRRASTDARRVPTPELRPPWLRRP